MRKIVWFSAVCLLIACSDSDDGGEIDTIKTNDNRPDVKDTGEGDGDADGDSDGDTDGDGDTDPNAPEACEECAGFEGADILVVVDNSISMLEEQAILATGFFTLINSLVTPTADWEHDPADNVRVGIVSSDMGLQYGRDGDYYSGTYDVAGCVERGDDGVFQSSEPSEVIVASGQISCDDDGAQCPSADWTCEGGWCVAPDDLDEYSVDCPGSPGDWTETSADNDLAVHVACMAQLGNEGCGAEQQLIAGVRALTRSGQTDFIRDNHLLAVIAVSDEEDCSIESDGLFSTPEWTGRDKNTACNLPSENANNYLFSIGYLHDELVNLKGGQDYAVLFAAIVGVPTGADSPCQGLGSELDDCLSDSRMQYAVRTFTDEASQTEYRHFEPACEREENGVLVTSARPGRRFVRLAQEFGCMSYVYSICNRDWSEAMSEIARLIAQCIEVVV
jgi:hypothetical protein